MNSWLIIGILVVYIIILFICAFFGEKYALKFNSKRRTVMFSLTLGVYCSSWTFYGATGDAVRQGFTYLAIYLGPLLFMAFGYDVWRRLGRIRQHHAIASISDFISARYGKSATLASVVTLLSVIGTVPYLALQLRAIAMSTAAVLPEPHHIQMTTNIVLSLTAILVMLSMVFGTRQVSHTGQHGGLMLAVAIESFVKLFAIVCISLFFIIKSTDSVDLISFDVYQEYKTIQSHGLPHTFWVQTLLAGLAMLCLPRQFHVGVVELKNEQEIKGARRWFSLYLIITAVAIYPIASWALHTSSQHAHVPDLAILMLPLSYDNLWLSMLAFLGGFSASTGMLLVSSVAISTMLSNDLIMPTMWRFGLISRHDKRLPSVLKTARRASIIFVMLLGFAFYHIFDHVEQLSILGLLAFSAVAQFAPALIGGLYWRGGSKKGVYAGLTVGFLFWAYTLLLPTILNNVSSPSFTFGQHILKEGLFGIYLLRPEALLGFEYLSPLTHGVLWSLGLNLILYIWVSRKYRPSVAEQIQAENFFYYDQRDVSSQQQTDSIYTHEDGSKLKIDDLLALASRITGEESAQRAFMQFSQENHLVFQPHRIANSMWWNFTEQYLASSIGAASARTLLQTVLAHNGLGVAQVANILDQASQWQRFNQNLLITMINHMTQGVSIVDANMCLVAWNNQYIKLFDYPKELIYVGCSVADLIRYNASRGDCGPGPVEEHVRKRVHWMKVGSAHEFERIRKDGRVIQIRGNAIEGGGFVTTFADITPFRENEAILEARVTERTQQLEDALAKQQLAREQADTANLSKSRFIAAASHDLLQPMHAARLFSTALEQSIHHAEDQQTLQQLDRALHGAESMLSALLDIARLESETIQPQRQAYPLHDLLRDLDMQFKFIALQRHIYFKVHDAKFWIDTDQQWIRRIIQNFVSNALRYTATGKVVVGVLRSASKANHIRIGVWDTGPGISEAQRSKLFQEFERCGHTSPWGEQGLGLGLAIVHRMTKMLGYSVTVYSMLGRGSCFMVEVPLTTPPLPTPQKLQNIQTQNNTFSILCLDNDDAILTGMVTLLSKWGYTVFKASEPEEAEHIIQQENIQVWMIDQHLNHNKRGLDFIQKYRMGEIPVALITADSDPELPKKLKDLNITLLKKPLKPASMRAWLSSLKISPPTEKNH